MQKPALGTLTPQDATLAAAPNWAPSLPPSRSSPATLPMKNCCAPDSTPGRASLSGDRDQAQRRYSGGLCSAGSTEYVRFFVYIGGACSRWDRPSRCTLAAVTPGHPLMYGVYRIQDSRGALQDLTGVPLRAILSAAQPPARLRPGLGQRRQHAHPAMIGAVEPGEHIRLMRLAMSPSRIAAPPGSPIPPVCRRLRGRRQPFAAKSSSRRLPAQDRRFNHHRLVKPARNPSSTRCG